MQKVSITQSLPLPVIRGAYNRWFCTGESQAEQKFDETDVELRLTYPGEVVLPSKELQIDVAVDEKVFNELKFRWLVSEWRRERDVTSSFVSDLAMCTSYLKIIGMGKDVIPLILSELRSEGDEPDHWFLALRVIADVDPVHDEDRGQIVKMARAWLAWGEQQGYAG